MHPSRSDGGTEEDMAALRASKKTLRRTVSQALIDVPSGSIDQQSRVAVRVLLGLDEYKAARRISLYLSMGKGEIQTRDIVNNALQSGKKLFVPYTYNWNTNTVQEQVAGMDMLALESPDDYQTLQPDNWGIPTPSRESVSRRENCFGGLGLSNGKVEKTGGMGEGLDLVIMPGIAFDRRCGRLGHGKGYYDSFLSRCWAAHGRGSLKRMPTLVGLALNEQILPENEIVPMTPTDWPLDLLVTGSGDLMRLEVSSEAVSDRFASSS